MADTKNSRFTPYFPLLLDALRSTHPAPMRPAEARAWIRERVDVSADDLTRLIQNGKQSIFENDVHWARFYLAKAMLIDSPRRGLWGLTSEGLGTQLNPESTWKLYIRVRDANRSITTEEESTAPAPEIDNQADEDISYWFAGAQWDKDDDRLARFLAEGIWGIGSKNQFLKLPCQMSPGDRIAIKAAFVQRQRLPFNVGGQPVAAMRIKATGTVLGTNPDRMSVRVAWDPTFSPRDWYFYTYLKTVVAADPGSEGARRLVDFTFRGVPQDYAWFLAQPYWRNKYGDQSVPVSPDIPLAVEESEILESPDEPSYTVADIIAEGCFLSHAELEAILSRWRAKKNLVLQGPPGTGKTWLAKRLGFAMVGANDRESINSRLRVVQFHPSLAYEDFVRGYRPAGEGRLALVDGIFLQCIEAAASEPNRSFVLVIEEINRGNPAQIFGEMLTLLEDTKRRSSESIELSYRKPGERGVHVPENLFVIGTMNVADRSLAIVDLALRRRFAFVDLVPNLGQAWRDWCAKRGLMADLIVRIEKSIGALNEEIASCVSLGPQFRIGHSYVTPDSALPNETDWEEWFRAKVETEICPLLEEYWYDSPDRARHARAKLLAHTS